MINREDSLKLLQKPQDKLLDHSENNRYLTPSLGKMSAILYSLSYSTGLTGCRLLAETVEKVMNNINGHSQSNFLNALQHIYSEEHRKTKEE